MSSGLRQFVSEEFCEVEIIFSFCGSFYCHFVMVVLQKDVMVVKGQMKMLYSRGYYLINLILYLNLKLFVKIFSSACI